jgi:hypothetical protein
MSEQTSPAKERILGFLDNEVANYILPDIDRLTLIRPDEEGRASCAAAHAMMLFAVIDLFGYLIRDDKNAKKKETKQNFAYLLSEKVGLFPQTYDLNWEMILTVFRHGLMHQFFAKASGISKSGSEKPLISENKSSGILILNVDVLSKDVFEALQRLKQFIVEDREANLADRMNERLDILSKEDYATVANLKGN